MNKAVVDRGFKILFDAACDGSTLGCPPDRFRLTQDECVKEIANEDVCLGCWMHYCHIQAQLDLHLIVESDLD